MRILVKAAISILVILAFSFLLPEFANAQCTCIKPNITALEEYKDATIVLTGEIVDIQKSERDEKDRYYETVKIEVDRVWKKNVDSTVTIKNYVFGCIQGWNVGDKYLVYAYLNDDNRTYSTGCCCS